MPRMDGQRYNRQIILPEIDPAGQERLHPSKAMGTIKLLLGIGKPLENRMIRICGLDMRIQCLDLKPNPECKAFKRI